MLIDVNATKLHEYQVFHLRRDVDGQPLGIVLGGSVEDPTEIREIVAGSPAAQQGLTHRVVGVKGNDESLSITEVNGRPICLFPKDAAEAGDRLAAMGRDVSVVVQPTGFMRKLKKQLKLSSSYKHYILS